VVSYISSCERIARSAIERDSGLPVVQSIWDAERACEHGPKEAVLKERSPAGWIPAVVSYISSCERIARSAIERDSGGTKFPLKAGTDARLRRYGFAVPGYSPAEALRF